MEAPINQSSCQAQSFAYLLLVEIVSSNVGYALGISTLGMRSGLFILQCAITTRMGATMKWKHSHTMAAPLDIPFVTRSNEKSHSHMSKILGF